MRPLLIVLMSVLLSLPVLAAEPGISPDQTVTRFLQRDLIGSRLTLQEWKTNIASLVGWQTEPDWAVLVVVEGYQAKPVQRAPDGLRAVVEYQVLGELLDGQWIPRKKSPELQRVHFLLGHEGDSWRIRRPIQPPHVSLTTAIRHLEALASEFSEPARQATLQRSLEELRNLQKDAS